MSEQSEAIRHAKRVASAGLRLIMEIRAETRPGLCPWCDEPIPNNPTGRKLKRCRKPECEQAYHTAHRSGRTMGDRLRKSTERRPQDKRGAE